jgi:hypothetical protein
VLADLALLLDQDISCSLTWASILGEILSEATHLRNVLDSLADTK